MSSILIKPTVNKEIAPFLLLVYVVICPLFLFAQEGQVEGRVFNVMNNDPIEFAKVVVLNSGKGAIADENGRFVIDNLEPGVYSFKAVFSGFKEFYIYDISITRARVVQ